MLRRSSILRRWFHGGMDQRVPAWLNPALLSSTGINSTRLPLAFCAGPFERQWLSTSLTQYKKRKSKDEKSSVSVNPKALKPKLKVVGIWKNMTVRDLSKVLEKDIDDIFEIFLYVDNSDPYDRPKAPIDNLKVIQDTVKKAGYRFKIESPPSDEEERTKDNKDAFRRPPAPESALVRRPPVVTIMGHVDHGKTTLLDALRHTSVVETEFGGITQHIGSFSVKLNDGDEVTFLDTPGHAAFKAMRARGAHITDIVVLVVAADDGVMQQTRESIQHAHEANVPIIVAINKIDKPEADITQVGRNLLECGIQLEEAGGDIQAVPVSALKGLKLNQLVEALVTQAELLNLRADPGGLVEAVVVESRTDPGRGKIATCIVQRGTLRKGCVLVAGTAWAKVRNLFDDAGRPMKAAPPGRPAQVIGWRDLPSAGDVVLEVESERRASEVIEWRESELTEEKLKEEEIAIQEKLNEHLKVYRAELEERRRRGLRYKPRRKGPREKEMQETDIGPRVSIVLKGDVDGSVETIMDVLETYHSEECDLDILSFGVGAITPNDVTMAATFSGTIYAFNIEIPADVKKLAVASGVTIKESNIIYRLVEDLKEELSEKLPMKDEDEILGEANVLAEFLVTEGKKKVPVAGCRCVKGSLKRDGNYRIIRGLDVIHEKGLLSSMRHIKSEVDTINKDKECGLMFEDESVRFEAGDTIVCYKTNQVKQYTDWDPGF